MSKKARTSYTCSACGYDTVKWFGRCPECDRWNTVEEQVLRPPAARGPGLATVGSSLSADSKPVPIGEVTTDDAPRFSTGYGEFDRVLGAGWLPGALTLIGGDPGVGKSSLVLQTSAHVARAYGPVLYVTGEESTKQIRLRADRLGAVHDRLLVMSETNLEVIAAHVEATNPRMLIIDSVQTMFLPDIASAPGSVTQVRESAAYLMRIAKSRHIATMLIGHVTKDGAMAGPRVLEHIVDTVLYLEGDRHGEFRILRAVKNRFGGTHEIGLFEMREKGLMEVVDASGRLLSEKPVNASGSIVVPAMEGSRPLLVEIQALVSASPFTPPRRTSDGIDVKRVHLLLAVLEKRARARMGTSDVYVRVAGGLSVNEPAADLGLVAALASSFQDRAPRPSSVVFGEVGLAGEVRAVSRPEQRLREAEKMGFSRVVLPRSNEKDIAYKPQIELIPVEHVTAALEALLS